MQTRLHDLRPAARAPPWAILCDILAMFRFLRVPTALRKDLQRRSHMILLLLETTFSITFVGRLAPSKAAFVARVIRRGTKFEPRPLRRRVSGWSFACVFLNACEFLFVLSADPAMLRLDALGGPLRRLHRVDRLCAENGIGEGGARAFARMLQKNTVLTSLNLPGE